MNALMFIARSSAFVHQRLGINKYLQSIAILYKQ